MKKIYQVPTTTIVTVSTANMIAASLGVSDTNASPNADNTYGLSRGTSFWDDDDE